MIFIKLQAGVRKLDVPGKCDVGAVEPNSKHRVKRKRHPLGMVHERISVVLVKREDPVTPHTFSIVDRVKLRSEAATS